MFFIYTWYQIDQTLKSFAVIAWHQNLNFGLDFHSLGDLESAPSLVRKSEDDCIYEFEWRTAAACRLGRKFGEDCTVFDDDAGRFLSMSFTFICTCL